MGEYRELIIVILLFIVLPLVMGGRLGVSLVRWGLDRRVGATRRCRRCDYALTGIDSARCPECGAELSGMNVVVGDRRANVWLVLAGVLVMAVSVAPVVSIARSDWYEFRPSLWVADDLASSNPATAHRAWDLLESRREAGTLSEAAERKVVKAILAEHASAKGSRLSGPMLKLFGEKYRDGKLTQAEQDQFFSQVMRGTIRVRAVVVAGGDLPCHVSGERRMLPDGEWWIRQTFVGGHSFVMTGGAHDGTHFGGTSILRGVVPKELGKRRIEIVERVEFFRGKVGRVEESRLCWSGETPHRFDVTVVADADAPEHFRMIDDPAMREPLRQAIAFSGVKLKDGSIEGIACVRRAPTSIAFEIVARAGEMEKRVGSFAVKKGDSYALMFGPFPFKTDTKRVDLLLRGDAKVGADSVDVFDAWHGEIVFPGEGADR
jgi:hypothetical protein